eukprot:CAMPEP_0119553010 /NCGR_PEP_ID=MMETSP1352-20130426/5869_1 /TAXON_ID=265584 /ORGANISM="Stauroneis constricta, Strain CCMP1120" /LENGTH=199 /DNA_ID=CAMNT_0007599339 /DNA_START=58 /DNA_END=657 /DNA_ORIENTATION=-
MTTNLAQAERPDWLQNDGEDNNRKSWTPAASTNGTDSDIEAATRDTSAAIVGGGDDDGAAKGSFCKGFSVTTISTLLMAGFVYAAYINRNDGADTIRWMTFYAANVIVPFLFLIHYYCCFPTSIIYSLASSMAIWAAVYLVIEAIQMNKTLETEKDDRKDDELKEAIYQLSGSVIAIVSALYHMMLVRCCVNKAKASGD